MVANKSSNPNTKEPLTEIFFNLGRPCAVPLILALGQQSYNPSIPELRQKIGSTVSKSEISKCLTNLVSLGLVQKTGHAVSNPELGFRLTLIGQEFYRHIIQMRYWAEKSKNFTNHAQYNVSVI
jgi:DNA-binding HxlR family transcriptional regulator